MHHNELAVSYMSRACTQNWPSEKENTYCGGTITAKNGIQAAGSLEQCIATCISSATCEAITWYPTSKPTVNRHLAETRCFLSNQPCVVEKSTSNGVVHRKPSQSSGGSSGQHGALHAMRCDAWTSSHNSGHLMTCQGQQIDSHLFYRSDPIYMYLTCCCPHSCCGKLLQHSVG